MTNIKMEKDHLNPEYSIDIFETVTVSIHNRLQFYFCRQIKKYF